MDNLLGYLEYIGSFDKLPETGTFNQIALVDNCLYLWQDGWHEVINYEENLLNKMIKIIKKAKNSKLKRELERLIEEENIYG